MTGTRPEYRQRDDDSHIITLQHSTYTPHWGQYTTANFLVTSWWLQQPVFWDSTHWLTDTALQVITVREDEDVWGCCSNKQHCLLLRPGKITPPHSLCSRRPQLSAFQHRDLSKFSWTEDFHHSSSAWIAFSFQVCGNECDNCGVYWSVTMWLWSSLSLYSRQAPIISEWPYYQSRYHSPKL